MTITMKLGWRQIPQLLLALAVLLYCGDWLVLVVRPAASTTAEVSVDQFLKTPLKNHKEEYDYMGTVDETCVVALFPHRSQTPCWWLKRHKTEWLSA